ncbi:MAG: hypothetical protein MUP11_00695, partial [Anaerolineales bacterium]|nr:hypothetical protein [Anaerolineales bacterium]
SLEQLMIGKTVIVIAHRLSTIRSADLSAVLKGKGIVELGNHEQLMALNGLYTRLNNAQEDQGPTWHDAREKRQLQKPRGF